MRQILTYTLILLVLASCGRHESSFVHGHNDSVMVDILLPVTPVKDQGETELCWIYAMLATVETERNAMGDSVNLSPLWMERCSLEEQGERAFFTGEEVSLRGTLPEAMRLMQKYGIVAWDAYHPDYGIMASDDVREQQQTSMPSSQVMERKVGKLARMCKGQKKGLAEFRKSMVDILDDNLGPKPQRVYMLGVEYTPLEFAHSVCLPGEWKAYTSFTHHPFGQPFAVEVPDNRQQHTAMNIAIDSLYNKVVNSLVHRHPVAWEGAMQMEKEEWRKENGKWGVENGKIDEGCLIKNKKSVQKLRQRLFERHILTDDHCMAIVGMGHLADGERVFICKNSWGVEDGIHGMRYITARQFLLSTIMIMCLE